MYNTKVTVELRELIESGVKLWDFDYPSYYKGEEKAAFEKKVVDHYYFRQIGQETTGRFLHYFRAKIREIMPYYIQRYKSVALFESVEDPLQSYDLTEEYTRDTESEGTTKADSSEAVSHVDELIHRHSDTPQGDINNILDHMSDASRDDNVITNDTSTLANSESTHTGRESYKLTRKGNIGVQPLGQEINVLRSSFINVDMEIIEELNDLFLKVY